MTAVAGEGVWRRRLERRRSLARLFVAGCQGATLLALLFLGILLAEVVQDAAPYLRRELVTHFPSRFPRQAGYASALVGTVYVAGLMSLVAFPLGVLAAVYLEEYARPGRLTKLLEVNIANLAAVPSVLYGLLGLGLFVEGLRMGKSVLAGALTLALLVLPLTILSSREAIRAVPFSDPGGRVRPGGHAVAGGAPPRAALRGPGHPHRHHPVPVPGGGGDRAPHHAGSAAVRALPAA
jgi:phosphate transport system permease protein